MGLPIRSIDFYYPEFQAANVRIFRDKSPMCFLEPIESNPFHKPLNLFNNVIFQISISPIISKEVLHLGWGLRGGNVDAHIFYKKNTKSKNIILLDFFKLNGRLGIVRLIKA